MRTSKAAKFVPDFPILKPHERRVKMRLLLGTHSARGLEVFRDVQEKVERTEIATRNNLLESKKRQSMLFPEDMVIAMTQGLAGVGCSRYREDAADHVMEFLSRRGRIEFEQLWPTVLEAVPVRLTHLRRILAKMKAEGMIAFDLPPRRRIPQPRTRISLARDPTGGEN